ncbi:MAG: peptidoglycan DD-metalloendopeptidase family protein [Bacteroidales bacterium]|nr:peptidoglycan DD-metalloendopeptidase family protein [Bacteroidales bacterium]
MKNKLFFILLFICVFISLKSQNLSDLKALKEKLYNDIQVSNNLLKKAQNDQKTSLGKVKLLNAQIKARQDLINNYTLQILLLEDKVSSSDSSIIAIQDQIKSIKKEYEKLLLEAYKNRNSLNGTIYFFSAETFNQAFMRYRMIQELNNYRKSQILILKKSNNALDFQKSNLLKLKAEIKVLLNDVQSQYQSLAVIKQQQESNLNILKKKERQLIKEIKLKEKKQADLELKIVELIRQESSKTKYSPSNFAKNRGKLNWPVKKGIIVSSFGKHPHPVLKGLMVNNNGLDIELSDDNNVYCIFDGEVSRVVAIPGYNTAVLVRHGKFLSVYANLSEVHVKSGTKIKEGSKIGKVFSDNDENSNILHFEIWEESKKIDPSFWLKR